MMGLPTNRGQQRERIFYTLYYEKWLCKTDRQSDLLTCMDDINMKQRSWVLIGIIAVIVIGVVAYELSPLFAFNSLKRAAKSGDRDRLEQVVDFPAVRENLKSQISASILEAMRADPTVGNASLQCRN
jgi:hypothetical protein